MFSFGFVYHNKSAYIFMVEYLTHLWLSAKTQRHRIIMETVLGMLT